MEFLSYSNDLIDILKLSGVSSIYGVNGNFIIPRGDKKELVRISGSGIDINSKSFNDKLLPSKPSRLNTKVGLDVFKSFMEDLSAVSEIKLNHFGISYYCTDLDDELNNIRELVGEDHLYEEEAGSPSTKWLFIGDAKNADEPLFELVLNERKKPVLSSWVPHFQIDIDTNLKVEELQDIITSHLGADWVKWKIDINGIGVPLVMGRLCSIGGQKIYLGIGTNKRDRYWHRSEGLRQL